MMHFKIGTRVYKEGDLNCKGNYKYGDEPVRVVYFKEAKQ
jgi:hypothetical protein